MCLLHPSPGTPAPHPCWGPPRSPPEHGGEGRGARGGRRGGNKAPGKQQQQPQPHWRGSGCPFVKQRQQEMRQSRLKRRIGWGEGIKKKMKKGGKNRPLWTEHKIPVMRRQWQPPRFGDLRTRTARSHCPNPSWQENNHQNPTFSFLFIFFPSFHQGKKNLHPFPLCWMSSQAPMATIRPGMLQCKNPSPAHGVILNISWLCCY